MLWLMKDNQNVLQGNRITVTNLTGAKKLNEILNENYHLVRSSYYKTIATANPGKDYLVIDTEVGTHRFYLMNTTAVSNRILRSALGLREKGDSALISFMDLFPRREEHFKLAQSLFEQLPFADYEATISSMMPDFDCFNRQVLPVVSFEEKSSYDLDYLKQLELQAKADEIPLKFDHLFEKEAVARSNQAVYDFTQKVLTKKKETTEA